MLLLYFDLKENFTFIFFRFKYLNLIKLIINIDSSRISILISKMTIYKTLKSEVHLKLT